MIVLTFSFCSSDYKIDRFSLEYTNWYGSEGVMYKYVINQDSLRIHYDCDFENCKDTIIYQKVLNKKKVYNFYSKLKKIKTDTLKKFYVGEYPHDREVIEIKGDSLNNIRIILRDYYHPEVEKITLEIDKIVNLKKFSIHN
ncbi:hypothetical protein [uncultured Tenacibaculum sp.]|nr:hypothetical protein [uncultured Tenacibaculum sp.]